MKGTQGLCGAAGKGECEMAGNPRPQVSVIIPTFNRAKMVCNCIDSVLAQSGATFEIVVVDDCSPDDTGARIRDRFGGDPRVKYIRNEANSFSAASKNNGARAASGEYLFFLDDDNILEPGAISELLECFRRHSDAGLVAPLAVQRRHDGENLVWTAGSDFNRWTSQPKDRHPNLPLGELPEEPADWPTTYSPNAYMVTRQAFDDVGGFDDGYKIMFDESDFGWRIMETGRSGWIASRTRTRHFGFVEPGCASQLRYLGIEKPYRAYCFARNRLRFARRHFSALQFLSVAFVFAPLSAAYYGLVAIRNRRPDIAWAYAKGTFSGIVGNLV